MKTHIVQSGQSLFDVAVICYGDVTGITLLLKDNPFLSGPTDRTYPGMALKYREQPLDIRRKSYLEDYKTIATISSEDMPEGIGYWQLNEYVVKGGVALPVDPIPDPGPAPDGLAIVENSITYLPVPEMSGGGYLILFAVTISGTYLVTITNLQTGLAQSYRRPTQFPANELRGFGIFRPGTYRIQCGPASSQITIQ